MFMAISFGEVKSPANPYRTKVWREKSLAKHVKQSIWRIKFGENVTILTIVVEL